MTEGRNTSTRGKLALLLGCGLLAAVSLPQVAQAAPGSRYIACATCAPPDLAWGEGEFDQVHLVATAPGVTNLHPQTVPVDALARSLAALRLDGGDRAWLDPDAAQQLAHALSKTLAQAGPQQEAAFLITSKIAGGVLGTRLGNSGTAFIDANGLNLILAESQVDFIGRYRATRMERPFRFGQRDQASGVKVAGEGAMQRRADWLVLPLGGAGPHTRTMLQPHPAAMRDEQFYQAQEMRLKALKRLREQDLIAEQEYQAKRKEILQGW